ncbi:hypothetical protein HDV00_008109 [Rhizophlyctis rosea]|nr:hypothetical protein HDV00_008109 [Rhizophlyctis rosea]
MVIVKTYQELVLAGEICVVKSQDGQMSLDETMTEDVRKRQPQMPMTAADFLLRVLQLRNRLSEKETDRVFGACGLHSIGSLLRYDPTLTYGEALTALFQLMTCYVSAKALIHDFVVHFSNLGGDRGVTDLLMPHWGRVLRKDEIDVSLRRLPAGIQLQFTPGAEKGKKTQGNIEEMLLGQRVEVCGSHVLPPVPYRRIPDVKYSNIRMEIHTERISLVADTVSRLITEHGSKPDWEAKIVWDGTCCAEYTATEGIAVGLMTDHTGTAAIVVENGVLFMRATTLLPLLDVVDLGGSDEELGQTVLAGCGHHKLSDVDGYSKEMFEAALTLLADAYFPKDRAGNSNGGRYYLFEGTITTVALQVEGTQTKRGRRGAVSGSFDVRLSFLGHFTDIVDIMTKEVVALGALRPSPCGRAGCHELNLLAVLSSYIWEGKQLYQPYMSTATADEVRCVHVTSIEATLADPMSVRRFI